ncbi:MAG: response regulator [Methanophagales archaeon]|nr:response regulator [Methanophagales archaeon]MCW3139501.1 response regulator [Methanophagales archaeon]MCW7069385.1 response regulator [Methanophagales archaeon]MCW7072807.1 response regulator [Methanophagales archaeon]
MSREEEEHVNLGIMSRTIRILHVDDEPADLEITRILIKREAKRDFEIVGVLSAKEALKRLETEHFDAIIADYKMPEMDGIELLEAVRGSEDVYAHVPFILFTGKGGPEVAKEALEKGADRYITKGGNTAAKQCHELAKAVVELVQEKR